MPIRRPSPWLVLTVLSLAVLAALVWPAVRSVRSERRRTECRSKLKQVAFALHQYHNLYGSFPPAYVRGPDGEKWHSWRVLILPFLGEEELYADYRFDEPWSSPHNRTLTVKMPAVYRCPWNEKAISGVTDCVAIVGRATAWPEEYAARLTDFRDGTSNTALLVEADDAGIVWTEPRDIQHEDVLGIMADSNKPFHLNLPPFSTHDDHMMVAFADGSVRALSLNMNRVQLQFLFTINHGRPPPGVNFPFDPADALAALPAARPATDFPSTDVVPNAHAALAAGRNTIYCATLAIGWRDLRGMVGGQPIALEGSPPLVDDLNRQEFDLKNLNPESYVARAGHARDGILEVIREELSRKFPQANTQLLENVTLGPQQFLIYTYLQKVLPFVEHFPVLEKPIEFQAQGGPTRVIGFGMAPFKDVDANAAQLKTQLTILDYAGDDEFILEFHTRAKNDRIILAKIAAQDSLQATLDLAQRRIAAPDPQHSVRELYDGEFLAVPRLSFGIRRDFPELTNRPFLNAELEGYFIKDAIQVIQFRLDESGAVFSSELEILGENGHSASPPGQRKFIFDRPFLLYLIERDADQPYFAAWIENAELMEAVK